MIERPLYMDKILPYIDAPFVKILTGIRRCGKSTLLEMLVSELKKRGVSEEQIIFIKFDSFENNDVLDYAAFYKAVRSRMPEGKKTYLLLDEIQEVFEWERALNSLMVDCDVDIYVTGSNSKLMSDEISTYLTGRYITIPVFTLSYAEYLIFRGHIGGKRELLSQFIRAGGFPATALQDYSESEVYTVVKDIYNSVVFKDIVKRNNIRKVEQFERVVKFIFENVGKTFSARSVANYMKSDGRGLDTETVYNYIAMLEKAFMVYRANRYDMQGKEVMKTQEKFFLSDQALKHAMLGFKPSSVAAIMENIVFLELKRRGYEAYIGKNGAKEIDFIGIKKDEKLYIQVCRELPFDDDGNSREIANLEQIRDHYPKYVVTMDEFAGGNVSGIKIVHLADFLTSDW